MYFMGLSIEQYPKIMEIFLRKVKIKTPFLLITSLPRLHKRHCFLTSSLPFLPFPGGGYTTAPYQNRPFFRKPNALRTVL
jgi:hypothetical protein